MNQIYILSDKYTKVDYSMNPIEEKIDNVTWESSANHLLISRVDIKIIFYNTVFFNETAIIASKCY